MTLQGVKGKKPNLEADHLLNNSLVKYIDYTKSHFKISVRETQILSVGYLPV